MPDPEATLIAACEWHEEYPENDCPECLTACEQFNDSMEDVSRERQE